MSTSVSERRIEQLVYNSYRPQVILYLNPNLDPSLTTVCGWTSLRLGLVYSVVDSSRIKIGTEILYEFPISQCCLNTLWNSLKSVQTKLISVLLVYVMVFFKRPFFYVFDNKTPNKNTSLQNTVCNLPPSTGTRMATLSTSSATSCLRLRHTHQERGRATTSSPRPRARATRACTTWPEGPATCVARRHRCGLER